MLSLLTVNIGAASPRRADRIGQWLLDRDDDVIIFTETSAGDGTRDLLDRYREAGWRAIHRANADDRGTAIVTRIPPDQTECSLETATLPHRIAATALATDPPITIVGVYVPSRDRSLAKVDKKRDFISSFLKGLAAVPDQRRSRMLIGGDYNVISRNHQPLHHGFLDFEFDMTTHLESMGMIDAFEAHAPEVQEHSWIGRTGDGYRYDYFHISSDMIGRIKSCSYLHTTRQQQLTDHAAVELCLDIDVPARMEDNSGSPTATLF